MLFDSCLQFNYLQTTLSLDSHVADFDESQVTKFCKYFDGFDFFDLAFDDVEQVDRLTTRCMKPNTPHDEVEEIIELIQNLGIASLLKGNVEVYQGCCMGLWNIGKKFKPLVCAKDRQELSDNFHLRLKLWTSIYRTCCYSCFNEIPCGIFDCKDDDFKNGIAAIQFGSLMNVAKFKENNPISCSCISTAWKVMNSTTSTTNDAFASMFLRFFELKSRRPPKPVDDMLIKGAYVQVSSFSDELYITVFYSLFPAFFPNPKKAGGILTFLYSKLSSTIPALLCEGLIECFSQHQTFIGFCEALLKLFVTKLNTNKDMITTNYFPDDFSTISTTIDDYSSPTRKSDDQFQNFLKLFSQALNDSQIGEKLVATVEQFWAQSKVPKVYSYYLMLLATTAKHLGPKVIQNQVLNLTGDDICPQECLFLRFFVLQRCQSEDLQMMFRQFKPKITVSPTNFSYFIQAFSSTVIFVPSEKPLFLTLLSESCIRRLSAPDASTFIKSIHQSRLSPIPSYIFEIFQKDIHLQADAIARFFGFHVSLSTVPSMEKVFCARMITFDLIESLVEEVVKRDGTFKPENVLFGCQLALLYSFTQLFLASENGKENFSKMLKLISPAAEVGAVSIDSEAIIALDTAIKKNRNLCNSLYTKWIFEIIVSNVKEYDLPICGQICQILLSDSFVTSSKDFKGSPNMLPLIYCLSNFVEKHLADKEFPNLDYQKELLQKLQKMEFPPQLVQKNSAYIEKIKKKIRDRIDNIEFMTDVF